MRLSLTTLVREVISERGVRSIQSHPEGEGTERQRTENREGILVVGKEDLPALVPGVGPVVDHRLSIMSVPVARVASEVLGSERVRDTARKNEDSGAKRALRRTHSRKRGPPLQQERIPTAMTMLLDAELMMLCVFPSGAVHPAPEKALKTVTSVRVLKTLGVVWSEASRSLRISKIWIPCERFKC